MGLAWKHMGLAYLEAAMYQGENMLGRVWKRATTINGECRWKAVLSSPYSWEGTFPTQSLAQAGLELVAAHAMAVDAASRLAADSRDFVEPVDFYGPAWQLVGIQLRSLGCAEVQ